MRCPECTQRNSVAARKCLSCGHKFKKKSVPPGLKIVAIAASVGIVACVGASIVMSQLADPETKLARIAKSAAEKAVEASTKSGGGKDVKVFNGEFDSATSDFLSKYGTLPDKQLTEKLGKIFPSDAFEIHLVNLPRAMKIVELDTALQAKPYLVMKTSGGAKVIPLNGVEVVDDAHLLNESSGSMLVLLGHSAGPRKPEIKVYSVMPDSVSDTTEKMIPPINGEGQARFAQNGRDITLDLSMLSLGQSEGLFARGLQSEDATVHQYFEWRDGRYTSRYEYGNSPFTPLYAAVRCMRHPELVKSHQVILGPKGQELVSSHKSDAAGNFLVRKIDDNKGKLTFALIGNVGAFKVDVAKKDGQWAIASAVPSSEVANIPAMSAPKTVASSAPAVNKGPAPIVVREPENKVSTLAPSSTSAKAIEVKPVETEFKKTKVASTEPASRSSSSASGYVQVSTTMDSDSINLRAEPSTNGASINGIPKGTKLAVLGQRNGWYKVRFGTSEGYVFGGLVQPVHGGGSSSSYTPVRSTKPVASLESRHKTVASVHHASSAAAKSTSSHKTASTKPEKKVAATPAEAPPAFVP